MKRKPMYILGAASDRDARTATRLLKLMGYPPGTFADCAHVFQLFAFAKGSSVTLGYIGNLARRLDVGPIMPEGYGVDRVGSAFIPAPLMTLNHFHNLPKRLYSRFETLTELDQWHRMSATSTGVHQYLDDHRPHSKVTSLPLCPSTYMQVRHYGTLLATFTH